MIGSRNLDAERDFPYGNERYNRVEERGQIKKGCCLSFFVVFEHTPVWLSALSPTFTCKIYIDTCQSFSELNSLLIENKIEISLYQRIIACIGPTCFVFDTPPQDVITLVSGSIAFLNEKYSVFRKRKAIFITETHKKFPNTKQPWKRIKHAMVGGATNFECLYSYTPNHISPSLSSMRRRLGDFVNYGVPPSTTRPPLDVVAHTAALSVKHLHHHIHYPTHFSHNGFGYRQLQAQELAKIFGFSTIDMPFNFTTTMFPVVPVQILTALLSPFLNSTTAEVKSIINTALPPINKDMGSTRIHTLHATLPHSWSKSNTLEHMVAKSDDATINNNIWDQRTTLLFPHITPSLLNMFRRRLMCSLYHKLFTEFKTYLKNKHPTSWDLYMSNRHAFLRNTVSHVFNEGGDKEKRQKKGRNNKKGRRRDKK